MRVNIFMNCRQKDEIIFAFAGLAAVFAGVLNGLIGTGGGMIIFFVLKKLYNGDAKKAFASVMAAVMPMALLSAYVYERSQPGIFYASLPYLPFAFAGGICGAALLQMIRTGLLKTLFALLLVISGLTAVIK